MCLSTVCSGYSRSPRGSQHSCPWPVQQGRVSRYEPFEFVGHRRICIVLIPRAERQLLTFTVASNVFTGDLTSQSPQQDRGDFNSLSDQYKECYFHPLKLTGIYVYSFYISFFPLLFSQLWLVIFTFQSNGLFPSK